MNNYQQHQFNDLEEAQSLLKGVKCKRIPIIDAQGNLVSLICRRDIFNQKRDTLQVDIPILTVIQLAVTVTTHKDSHDRIKALVDVGLDIVCIDSSQGNSVYQIELIKYIRNTYPKPT